MWVKLSNNMVASEDEERPKGLWEKKLFEVKTQQGTNLTPSYIGF